MTPEIDEPDLPPAAAARRPTGPRMRAAAARAGGAWSGLSVNMRGSLILTIGLVSFTAMTILIKEAGRTIPLAEILTVRQLVMQAFMMPLVWRDLPAVIQTPHRWIHVGRGLLQLGAMTFSFMAVVNLPLSIAMTISFSYSLIVTVGAAIVVGESVDRARWIAALIGFAGVAVMLKPGGGIDPLWAFVAVLGAVFSAASAVSLRLGPKDQPMGTILTYQALVLLAGLAVPTAMHWVTPSAWEWLLLLAIGVTGTVGQFTLTAAYRLGDAAALAPLDFLRLLLTAAWGLLVLGEVLDGWMIAGGALLIGATAYTFRANARSARRG